MCPVTLGLVGYIVVMSVLTRTGTLLLLSAKERSTLAYRIKMGFKDYLTEAVKTDGKDPREKEKVAFFGAQVSKVFGIKLDKTKRQSDWTFTFRPKSLNLGWTTLRLRGGLGGGDILFGESSGVFTSFDVGRGREKVEDAYEKKFGARGQQGEKTFNQLKKEFEKSRK